jgi:hypothetical protein
MSLKTDFAGQSQRTVAHYRIRTTSVKIFVIEEHRTALFKTLPPEIFFVNIIKPSALKRNIK